MAKLFIICGHGAGDPGACGNGFQEAERVRTLASRIKAYGGNNVTVGDTSKDWYKSGLVNNSNIPKGSLVLELHMDSASASARGAHVIIKTGFDADKYDKALANFLTGILPGRSNKIVGRDNLANVNRAANCGINYRLAECGFISNAEDVNIFNSRMDDIAKGILSAFEINTNGATPTPSPAPVAPTPKPSSNKIAIDGKWGKDTTSKTQKVLGTPIDGIVSNQLTSCQGYFPNVVRSSWVFETRRMGGSVMIKALQNLVGSSSDGYAGKNTVMSMQKFLNNKGYNAGSVDGYMGANTVSAWQRYINDRL